MVRLIISVILCLFVMGIRSSNAEESTNTAIFAGGCFWCMEKPFEVLDGVIDVQSGYIGGIVKFPSYEEVSRGTTGHIEAIKVVYNPEQISYKKLLDVFWRNVDPFDAEGQFCDKGEQYISAIFYSGDSQKSAAQASIKEISDMFGNEVVTQLKIKSEFYPAEEYHQNYYKKNPIRYAFFRKRCGRDSRLKELWEE